MKKIVTLILLVMLMCGVAAPKAYADDFSNTLGYSGGLLLGGGLVLGLAEVPDADTCWIFGACLGVPGLLLIIWGICDAIDKGDPIFVGKTAPNADNSLRYVKFGTNGKDSSLSVTFDF